MNNRLSVLVVDDSRDMLELIRRQLQDFGFTPFVSDNVVDAIEIIENSEIDLLITDIKMPKIGGEQLIRYVSEHFPKIPVLVITGFPEVNAAVAMMKMGVMEYLIKPFTSDELQNSIDMILAQIGKNHIASETKTQLDEFQGIIGKAPKMQDLYQTINRTKNNRATILISGESGTGKELVARAIHYNSDYASAPFVPVNCGAIPDQLLESELFGHLKGSFTGAISNRAGFFQAADSGTLFLDEISNTSLEVQAKLLRAIQEKEITVLGGTKSQKINVRIVTASNVNLLELIDQGKFREDLYYRLNVISIEIPPLRERVSDITTLVNHFNKKYSKELNKKPLKCKANIIRILEDYSWPGNVRELENFIQRLVIMIDTEITVDDIPPYMKAKITEPKENISFLSLEEMEKKYIQKVLNANGNNKTKAAEILKIDRKTLREKLK